MTESEKYVRGHEFVNALFIAWLGVVAACVSSLTLVMFLFVRVLSVLSFASSCWYLSQSVFFVSRLGFLVSVVVDSS